MLNETIIRCNFVEQSTQTKNMVNGWLEVICQPVNSVYVWKRANHLCIKLRWDKKNTLNCLRHSRWVFFHRVTLLHLIQKHISNSFVISRSHYWVNVNSTIFGLRMHKTVCGTFLDDLFIACAVSFKFPTAQQKKKKKNIHFLQYNTGQTAKTNGSICKCNSTMFK